MIRLSAIFVYPLKSCRGLAPVRWELDTYGLRLDRSWMVVDDAGRFLTQRERPALALVDTALDARWLVLSAPGREPLALPLDAAGGRPIDVEVWNHRGPAMDQGEAAAEWVSAHLGTRARIVRVPPGHSRRVSRTWFAGEAHAAFSDGYPLLVLSEASRADLNRRLERPLPVNRFRPNLVFTGCEPYAEDTWRRVRVGDVELVIAKPCSRCVITTTDQAKGERDGTEPLRTLATYRNSELGVLFAQNAVHLGPGTLELGAPVEVLETRPAIRLTPADA